MMIHTRRIGAEEASRFFRWLDTESDFRDYAIDVFSTEMTPPYIVPPSPKYYLVHEGRKGLLIIKAAIKAECMDIAFSRVFNKTEKQKAAGRIEAHVWLKNALEEALIPHCRSEGLLGITAVVPRRGELIFAYLEDMDIKDVAEIKRTPGYGGIRVRIELARSASPGVRRHA